jgi:hypothetical protein
MAAIAVAIYLVDPVLEHGLGAVEDVEAVLVTPGARLGEDLVPVVHSSSGIAVHRVGATATD